MRDQLGASKRRKSRKMALTRATQFLRKVKIIGLESATLNADNSVNRVAWRNAASTRSGAILPEPKTTPFGIVGVVCGVVVGLFIGAAISKNVANFLEENDLFVPSDDDDDDD